MAWPMLKFNSGMAMTTLVASLMKKKSRSNVKGFSLTEIVIVMATIGTMAAAASVLMPALINQSKSDGATAQVVNTLRVARDRAIGERRNVEVRFLGTNHIQIARQEIPGPATTVVADMFLEGGQRFLQYTGVPDTPDYFGALGPIAFGSTPTIMFTSEGTFVDSVGDVLNGTLFLGKPGEPTTGRAITVFGTTALLHLWKWDGRQWTD